MVDIVSYRVTIGLFYNKISMICLRKARKVSVCLSDFIDMFLLYLRHVMSWCLVKYKSNYNIILSYLLLGGTGTVVEVVLFFIIKVLLALYVDRI